MSQLTADLLLLMVTFVWGSTSVIVKDAISMMGPLTFLAVRFSMAGLVMLAWYLTDCAVRRRRTGDGKTVVDEKTARRAEMISEGNAIDEGNSSGAIMSGSAGAAHATAALPKPKPSQTARGLGNRHWRSYSASAPMGRKPRHLGGGKIGMSICSRFIIDR